MTKPYWENDEDRGRVARRLEELNEQTDDDKQPSDKTTNSASETSELFDAKRDFMIVEGPEASDPEYRDNKKKG